MNRMHGARNSGNEFKFNRSVQIFVLGENYKTLLRVVCFVVGRVGVQN